MTVKPGDFHSEGQNDKPVDNFQSAAEGALRRLHDVVKSDRDAARPNVMPELAENRPASPEMPTGDSTAFLSPTRPLNYYDGKLSAGAGAAAENGLKGLFNIDRLNNMLTSSADSAKPYNSTRVDGLSTKKDQLSANFKVPDFVPPFPSN